MDIEKFKEKCNAQKKQQDEKERRWQEFINIQEKEYLNYCFAPHKKFNWRKLKYEQLCPNCKTKLEKEIIKMHYYESDWDDIIYYCPNCGYEYAR